MAHIFLQNSYNLTHNALGGAFEQAIVKAAKKRGAG
jgi:hypothetical protein